MKKLYFEKIYCSKSTVSYDSGKKLDDQKVIKVLKFYLFKRPSFNLQN